MNTAIISSLIILFAGILNGSFAMPSKYIKHWNHQNIWFAFSWMGFLLVPWTLMYIFFPNLFSIFKHFPANDIDIAVIGGLLWGLSMICFTQAFKFIGIGLAFVINIGVGAVGGAIIPILTKNSSVFLSIFGIIIIISFILFLNGVALGAYAGKLRDDSKNKTHQQIANSKSVTIGIFLSILAGIGSAIQGSSYNLVNPNLTEIIYHFYPKTHTYVASNIAWLIIFSAAFIPYMLFFLYGNIKNKHFFQLFATKASLVNWLLVILMGLFFFVCIILFSFGSTIMGINGSILGWPIFMSCIILAANFWSWIQGEWRHCGKKAAKTIIFSILIIIIAVIVFSYAQTINPLQV